jgi:nucleoid-associated protein YgaU
VIAAPAALLAVLLLLLAGCSTSSKLAAPLAYDVAEGDYLTEREYEELSKDEAIAYCQELEREIDILNDNAQMTSSSLAQTEEEIAALRARIDEVRRDLEGREVAQADATAPPPSTETPSGLPTSYRVVPGDWLSKIALKTEIYGDWREWPRIYRANDDQIRDPDLIYPDQVFTIPRGEGDSDAGNDTSLDPEGSGRTHVVAPGETLRILAERYYGSREEWDRIWDANRAQIPDPDRIPVGLSVVIP